MLKTIRGAFRRAVGNALAAAAEDVAISTAAHTAAEVVNALEERLKGADTDAREHDRTVAELDRMQGAALTLAGSVSGSLATLFGSGRQHADGANLITYTIGPEQLAALRKAQQLAEAFKVDFGGEQ